MLIEYIFCQISAVVGNWMINKTTHQSLVIGVCIKTGDPVLPICQLISHTSFCMNGRIWYHFLGPCQAHLPLSMLVIIAMTNISSGALASCLHKFPKKRIRWGKPHPNRLKDPLRRARSHLRLKLTRSHPLRYAHSCCIISPVTETNLKSQNWTIHSTVLFTYTNVSTWNLFQMRLFSSDIFR